MKEWRKIGKKGELLENKWNKVFKKNKKKINKILKNDFKKVLKEQKKISLREFKDLATRKASELTLNALMKKNKGHPLFDVHQAIMDKAMEGHNQKGSVTQTLLRMGERIGKLMGVTEKATDPKSPGGETISPDEKEEIYKALNEVKSKIAELELSIK